MSPTPDRTLGDLQQTIADLKRQLAESNGERDHFRSERDEALEQQTATAEVLGVINSSPGDLAPVFDAMLEWAVRLCEFDLASLWTYDGSAFHPAARHRVPDPLWAYLQDHAPPTFARLVDVDRLVHIADVHQEAIYQTDYGREVRRLGLDTVRSLLIVPLRKEEVLLGALTVYRQEVRPFSDKQIALLQNFASQAVVAMENARLITETREALEQQTATAEVLGVINSSPGDLAPVFDAILEKAHSLCGAEIGSLTVYDGEENRAVATRGLTPSLAGRLRQGFRPGPAHPIRELLSGARIVQVADVGESADPIALVSLELGGIRTSLYVPLRKDDRLLGLIVASRQEVRLFSDKEITLLENFAAQAVIAMENARLITETREALEQQTATAEVLQVINSSPGDLAPVFDAMLERAMRLCEAAFGVLWAYEGDRYRAAAVHGAPVAFVEFLRQPLQLHYHPGSGLERALGGENLVINDDMAAEEAYRADDPLRRAIVDLGGARSHILVTLRKDETTGRNYHLPHRDTAIHRQADRAAAELRRAGGDRDGKCAAARGIASAHR
jgi:GAF domain-containing protein